MALDAALCYGWIDTQVRGIDEDCYMQRFTPRKSKSYWSAVNIKRAGELLRERQMTPAGLKAFRQRDVSERARYSFESRPQALDPAFERRFRASKTAWAFFESEPPSFRRLAVFWVMSAKKPETRERRLETFIDCSARGERPKPFRVAAKDRA